MLTVKQSFFWNGVLFHVGMEVDPGDPVVAGKRHLFDADNLSVAPVEAATAVPGEKRSVAKKSAGKAKLASKRGVAAPAQ
jgi:hypothetical protein